MNYGGEGIGPVNSTGLGNVICQCHTGVFVMYLGLVIHLIKGCRNLVRVGFVIEYVCLSILILVTNFALFDNDMVRYDDPKTPSELFGFIVILSMRKSQKEYFCFSF